jgi:hypothetical protein
LTIRTELIDSASPHMYANQPIYVKNGRPAGGAGAAAGGGILGEQAAGDTSMLADQQLVYVAERYCARRTRGSSTGIGKESVGLRERHC